MHESVTHPTAPPAPELPTLEALAAELRRETAFGRSGVLGRLFDFLLEQSLAGRSPKGVEIADRVLGLATVASDASDASVRVYIHRLRKRLEEHYAAPARRNDARIALGRGEYRLVVERGVGPSQAPEGPQAATETPATVEPAPVEPAPTEPSPSEVATPSPAAWSSPALMARAAGLARARPLALMGVAVAVLAVLNLYTALMLAQARRDAPPTLSLRHGPLWSKLLDNGLPTLVVVGDYYLFGDTEGGLEVKRLVRDFAINSQADLDAFRARAPDASQRYADVSLSYLPVASALALQDILPLVRPPTGRSPRPRVVTMSKLTPDMLKHTNVVYIGYLSGLGLLRSPALSASRFRLGGTYDEITDAESGRAYVSQAGSQLPNDPATLDYGLVSSFPGPDGGRILVIAGARDLALTQLADAVSSSADVAKLGSLPAGQAFEALYEVRGINGVPLRSRVVASAPLATSAIWDPKFLSLKFPES